MRSFLVVVGLVSFSSCVTARVALPAPPSPNEPEASRRNAFSDLAPVGQVDVVSLHSGVPVARTAAFLMLGNGLRVEDPRDLLVAVPIASATAQYAAEFGTRFDASNRALVVEIIGLALGVTLAGVGMAMGLSDASFGSTGNLVWRPGPGLPFASVGVGMTVVALVAAIFRLSDTTAVAKARESAFLTYPRDLESRLGLREAPLLAPVTSSR